MSPVGERVKDKRTRVLGGAAGTLAPQPFVSCGRQHSTGRGRRRSHPSMPPALSQSRRIPARSGLKVQGRPCATPAGNNRKCAGSGQVLRRTGAGTWVGPARSLASLLPPSPSQPGPPLPGARVEIGQAEPARAPARRRPQCKKCPFIVYSHGDLLPTSRAAE